ncbi:DNA mismatch repair protein MutS [Geotoga petraea]|jgi:DNA mismatch repair protein MutS|uniref:DNA mismatch repair protein MutS n=1 Tax=Geotoga petraea TaxID=28234 RepID=A0A1G6N5K2_9BACT|nr:DNA mismatch repair protein MutS [Geotoga petraea]MDK2945543.1 mismatch repair protein MutS [Geotoga sp.]TGG87248.1 DNA mismatch repair protein MutS [Geotoga petraea]SDC62405.1 DNA mismatch repair protein MutS [Geotoga petraea]
MAEYTPMMKQYLEIKEKNNDSILLFRLGDFYETFFEDAKKVSEILQIVLTKRNNHPMAGIPYHALDNYLKKLLDNGLKVAICDQVEDPSEAKGIVKREVTRVITPGTIIEENMLDENNRFSILVDYDEKDEEFLIVLFDFSTGELYIDRFDISQNELLDMIISNNYSQVLLSFKLRYLKNEIKTLSSKIYTEVLEEWYFSSNYEEHIKESYDILTLGHLPFDQEELKSLDAVLKYLELTQFKKIKHLNIPKKLKSKEFMYIDINTLNNLNIVSNENRGKSVYDILRKTKTPMGHRKLKDFLSRPLIDEKQINQRLDLVEVFFENNFLSEEIKEYLSSIKDIDRIISRISLLKSTPKDLIALKDSLTQVPYIKEALETNEKTQGFFSNVNIRTDLKQKIEKHIFDEPSNEPGDGKVIKKGISKELDEYRSLITDIDTFLENIQKREKEKTGITTLKLGRNKIYGFYIEISKAQSKEVPDEYIRKQTLTNTERFITEELRELEKKVIIAEEKVKKIEKTIFLNFIKDLSDSVKDLKTISEKISYLDVIRSFAEISKTNRYTRPYFVKGNKAKIESSRHPVVEKFVDNFTQNDFEIEDKNFIVLTGPNMSGKSTYLRQIGILSILAQAGCFVPAKKAHIPLYDRVFTRIGAKDDIVTGKSTFLVEMMEMSTILNQATERSLVLLDEVGRGTSTLDGISVAWAISEYLFQILKSNTIFATHYTELTMLSEIYDNVITKRVQVKETKEGVLFLHKIENGVSDNSYGIEVARLAGFPSEIVDRAKEVLENLSDKVDLENRLKKMRNINRKKYKTPQGQLKMF